MRRTLLTLSLTVIIAHPAGAASFVPSRIAPEWGIDALTRGVARQQVQRDLFSDPYATVTLGSTDVYSVFPYVESRTFQVVSDPRWNRLVYGEMGQSLSAYDGKGQRLGALSNPRGMAVDERNRVYVADTGNDRVLVLQATTEYGDITLVPQFEIRGLSGPYDVSYSDGGTPFVAGDDRLYVADTGKNRVVAYALETSGARQTAAIGELGNGPGRFAGPMSITAGRANGASTADVYVADAHTQRIVQLRDAGNGLTWVGASRSDADVVTSLDTDQWGNLYAAAPNRGLVRKYAPDLTPLAELRGDLARPRSFRVPFFTVRDHRTNTTTREGRPNALSVEQWTDASGMRLWNLGPDVADLSVQTDGAPAARFTLTDPASVTLEIVDATTGRTLVRRGAGAMTAGLHAVALTAEDLATAGSGDRVLRVTAKSSYANGTTAVASTAFRSNGGTVMLPAHALLIGGWPNPVMASTRIDFVLPQDIGSGVTLRIYDAGGRVVRTFSQPFSPGRNQVVWDGTSDRGPRVPAGIYFARLKDREREQSERLVVVR